MMERLFAVGEQKKIFLLWLACGFAWGIMTDGADAVRKRYPRWGMLLDAAAAAALFGMILTVLVHTHEGVRLYGLLGAVIGALLYRSGLSVLLHAVGMFMKKAFSGCCGGRRNG